MTTRSTPRAQTSAMPSLKSMKQSTQSWNSIAYCFLCQYPEDFINVHPSGITWCCQETRTQKIEKGTLCPRGQPITLKMIQIVPCVIANISKKFHGNQVIVFTVVLLTNRPGAPRWETVKQSRYVWNSLANYFLCHAWRFIKISWKSIHPFFHNITNKHGSRK